MWEIGKACVQYTGNDGFANSCEILKRRRNVNSTHKERQTNR